jgi:hypothetical protein
MVVTGGTVFGAHRFLGGQAFAATSTPVTLSETDLALLAEVADTIVPRTKTSGGAKDAAIADFIADIASTFYDEHERDLLRTAPAFFDDASRTKYSGRDFRVLHPDERLNLLLELGRQKPQPEPYRMVKQLTLWGYWTSEIAAKQALEYLPVPGAYRGCVDATPDAKAMF